MEGRAAAAQLVDDRLVDERGELPRALRVDPGHRRVAAHAACVRALVAVEDALVVLRGRERHGALAVAEREQRELLALEELLEHHLGVAEALLGEEHVERRARLALVLGDDHALARGQHVGLQHGRVGRAGEVLGGLVAVAEQHVRGGRHARPSSAAWRRPSSPRCARPPWWARRRRCRRAPARPPARPRAAPRAPPPRGRPRARARAPRRRRRAGTRRRRARCPRCRARTAARAPRGLRSSARTSACSRPPPPTTRTALAQSAAMKSSTGIAASVS